jgi:hypothetical protein
MSSQLLFSLSGGNTSGEIVVPPSKVVLFPYTQVGNGLAKILGIKCLHDDSGTEILFTKGQLDLTLTDTAKAVLFAERKANDKTAQLEELPDLDWSLLQELRLPKIGLVDLLIRHNAGGRVIAGDAEVIVGSGRN